MPLPDAPPIAPVVITAARLPTALGDIAFSSLSVDKATLEANDRLDNALTTVPGVSLFRRTSSLGANPTTQGVSLRGIGGSGASRALVTLDGVPQNDPFGGWVIWTGLPSETLSGVTVVRGAGSGAYGAGALTGVIALEQAENVAGDVAGEVEAGGLGFKRGAAIAEIHGDGATRAFLDASGESSHGWIPVRAGRGAADRDLTLEDYSVAERVETQVGRVVVSERIGGYQEDRGSGALYARSRASGAQASLTLAAQPTADQWGWRLQGWASGSDLRNDTSSVAVSRQTATLANDQFATPAYGVGLNAALRRSNAAMSFEVGADLRDFSGESDERLYTQGVASGSRTSGGASLVGGVYSEFAVRRGDWLATASGRLDGWTDYGSTLVQTGRTALTQSAADQNGVVPTGRAALRRDLGDALFLRAAAYAGFRPATLNELHRTFRVGNDVTLANAALVPERLYGAELGVGGSRGLDWSLDAFYNSLLDAITNVTVGHGPGSFAAYPVAGFVAAGGTLYQRQNVGRIDAYGLEGEVRRRVGSSLQIRTAFSYTHARVAGGAQAPQLTGLRPAETPEITVTAGLTWAATSRVSVWTQLRYEGDRFDDDQNTRLIAAGSALDARVSLALGERLSVYVGGENLLDDSIQTGRTALGVVSFDAPRMVKLGLTLRR